MKVQLMMHAITSSWDCNASVSFSELAVNSIYTSSFARISLLPTSHMSEYFAIGGHQQGSRARICKPDHVISVVEGYNQHLYWVSNENYFQDGLNDIIGHLCVALLLKEINVTDGLLRNRESSEWWLTTSKLLTEH